MFGSYYIKSLKISHIDESLLEKGAKAIYENRQEFDEYIAEKSKLLSVKKLKELIGCGLREAKDIIDLLWSGDLVIIGLKEERKQKLERLAKKPLVEELVSKFKNLKDEEIYSMLMKLNIDELLSIDDFINENKN